ncbi:stalk domain-containing protein [Bacillus sp. REN10]|uniref:stalk domain-containing protein n=1 Tax=Bacillus sp. REN10 TaxID=2782541 RepID=UPI00193B1EC6|nr:stalk domain-containing protein [Bacillus sp. REN10]
MSGLSAVIIPKENIFTVSYTLPSPPAASSMLLQNWFVKVKGKEIKKTALYLTDKKLRTGNWYSALPNTGEQKKELIHYYEFQGKGVADVLYWQSSPLIKIQIGKNFTLYGHHSMEIPELVVDSLKSVDMSASKTIVMTDQHPAYSSDHFYIVNNHQQLIKLADTIKVTDIKNKYHFNQDEEWLAEVILALELNRPFGSQKSQKMYQYLQQQLTPEELKTYRADVLRMKQEEITVEQLDRALSKVKGLETNFFQDNKGAGKGIKSLLFTDTRSVIINGKVVTFRAVNKNGALLFPFHLTLRQLGFDVRTISDSGTLLVKKGIDTYRFDLDQHRFILNEEDYGLYEDALVAYNGELYIESTWLQKIFLVYVHEQEDQIIIDPIDL